MVGHLTGLGVADEPGGGGGGFWRGSWLPDVACRPGEAGQFWYNESNGEVVIAKHVRWQTKLGILECLN